MNIQLAKPYKSFKKKKKQKTNLDNFEEQN